MAETPKRSEAGQGPGESCPPDYIHDVASAAIRARVSPDTIRGWIQGGMRAMPIGRVGKECHRHYRIKDAWLMTFMDRRSVEHVHIVSAPAPPEPSRKRGSAILAKAEIMDISDPIGPILRGRAAR